MRSSNCLNVILSFKAFDTIAWKYEMKRSRRLIGEHLIGSSRLAPNRLRADVSKVCSLNGYRLGVAYTGSPGSQVILAAILRMTFRNNDMIM